MTSTTPDIHHTRHPPHQTSTKPDNHHTLGKIGHPPHQTSTTPDIHHTMWGSRVVDVLFYSQCGGCLVWWMSGAVDVRCGGCLVWWMSVWWMSVWWISYKPVGYSCTLHTAQCAHCGCCGTPEQKNDIFQQQSKFWRDHLKKPTLAAFVDDQIVQRVCHSKYCINWKPKKLAPAKQKLALLPINQRTNNFSVNEIDPGSIRMVQLTNKWDKPLLLVSHPLLAWQRLFWKSGKHLNVLSLRAAMSFPVSFLTIAAN